MRGGRNARELMVRYPKATLSAVDYSDVSLEKTRKTNGKAIEDGRCQVAWGDVSSLPFDGEAFDLGRPSRLSISGQASPGVLRRCIGCCDRVAPF